MVSGSDLVFQNVGVKLMMIAVITTIVLYYSVRDNENHE